MFGDCSEKKQAPHITGFKQLLTCWQHPFRHSNSLPIQGCMMMHCSCASTAAIFLLDKRADTPGLGHVERYQQLHSMNPSPHAVAHLLHAAAGYVVLESLTTHPSEVAAFGYFSFSSSSLEEGTCRTNSTLAFAGRSSRPPAPLPSIKLLIMQYTTQILCNEAFLQQHT